MQTIPTIEPERARNVLRGAATRRSPVHLKRGLLLVLLLGSRPALAQSGDAGVDATETASAEAARAEARAHFDQGVELAAGGDFERALAEFEAAYRGSPNFVVLYNIGQAHIELGQPQLAIAALEQYLRDGALEISPERVAATRAQIVQQKAQVAEPTVIVEPPATSVELDGQTVGQAPLLTTSTPPQEPDPFTTGAIAGADEGVRPEPRSSQLEWLGYALGGLGVAAGGVALGHYLYNRERYQDWQAEDAQLSSDPPPDDYRERQLANNELASSIDDASRVTVGLSVASGVLVAGGITVLVVDATREPAGTHSARGSELSVSLGGTW